MQRHTAVRHQHDMIGLPPHDVEIVHRQITAQQFVGQTPIEATQLLQMNVPLFGQSFVTVWIGKTCTQRQPRFRNTDTLPSSKMFVVGENLFAKFVHQLFETKINFSFDLIIQKLFAENSECVVG